MHSLIINVSLNLAVNVLERVELLKKTIQTSQV
jgi:hypothetical protein